MSGERRVSDDWAEEPRVPDVGEEACENCRGRGIVRCRGPEDYGASFESESCETCRGWGVLKTIERKERS